MAIRTTSTSKLRLWVLSYGLYPGRVLIYLKEEGLEHHFDIINVQVTPSGQEDLSGKPTGTLPILEIGSRSYIYQSAAILEYLEDVYSNQEPDMRGITPKVRARVRDCMAIVNDATTWLELYIQNGSSLYAAMREQSVEAAKEGLMRMHKSLSLLEKLADAEGPFLVGDSPTTVGCVLAATVRFAKGVYGVDLLEEHSRLGKVMEAFERRGSTAGQLEVPDMIKEADVVMHVR